jgi:hypothetical protein
MRRLAPALSIVLLSSCVAPPREAPRPAPAPQPAPAPAPATPILPADWTLWPMTAGDWRYRQVQGGSIATFGPAQGAPLASIRCDLAGRRILISRPGTLASAGMMTVRTAFGAAQWPVTVEPGTAPQVVAARAAGDRMLDRIASSRGRFTLELPGLTPLVLPPWAEVGRVIEDCRG